jgi:hypothetical protein
MLGLLTCAPRIRKPLRRSTTLFVERLEDRLSPSSAATEALSMNVTYDPNKQVTLTGTLMNGSGAIANQTINFGGVVNGTATTNSQGAYSVTLSVSALGQVTAASADGQSNTASATLAGGSPVVNNFDAMPEGSGLWCFTGSVTGAPAQGEVVNFGGIPALVGKSVNVNADGSFCYYAIVNSGQGGTATAQAVDWWGDTSPVAADLVNC